ncbi:acyl-CoA desaturase [Nocardia brasiliensis]|uniref:acyl-CoA desaturase n=1 Tax=Nocardia brasiliensis TaxID=37326 RepID=UPI001EEA8536|nr:acyl-CoA desaturase [Nocardia brasiliensis]
MTTDSSRHTAKRDRTASRLAYLTVGLPTVGAVAAVVHASTSGLFASDVVAFVLMYAVTALGIEAGFHRYFAHRSFEAVNPVKVFLGISGSMALQGPIIFWVATHRVHHAYADTERDPHSPRPRGSGPAKRWRGLWHGHVGWLFRVERMDWSRHCKDLLQDRGVMKMNAYYFHIALAGIVLPGLVAAAATQSVRGLIGGILWGGFARIFVLDHVTWMVNSLGHTIGSRPYPTRDGSTNIALLAPPSVGGSWHNNHHARPSLARTRRHWWQLDLAGDFIRLLNILGLVSRVRAETKGELGK